MENQNQPIPVRNPVIIGPGAAPQPTVASFATTPNTPGSSGQLTPEDLESPTTQNISNTAPINSVQATSPLPNKRPKRFSRALFIIIIGAIGIIGLLLWFGLLSNRKQQAINKQGIKEQAVTVDQQVSDELSVLQLKGDERKVVITGDVVTRGNFSVGVNGLFGQFVATQLTATQEYLLPNASGTLCLSVNNCNFLQSINNQTGTLVLQGTPNQINVAAAGQNITISAAQDIATTSKPTFNGVILTGTGTQNGSPICDDSNNCGAWLQGGNSFGATGVLGTNDGFNLNLETNNTARIQIAASNGHVAIGNSAVLDSLGPIPSFLGLMSGETTLLVQESYSTLTNDFTTGTATLVEVDLAADSPTQVVSGIAGGVQIKAGNANDLAGAVGIAGGVGFESDGDFFAIGGVAALSSKTGAGTGGFQTGLYGQSINASTGGSMGLVAGGIFRAHNTSLGTTTNQSGITVLPSTSNLLTTNNYGIFIADQSAAGALNNYNFYSDGPGISYFGGNVGIGVTAPVEELEVVGNTDISGQLAVGSTASIATNIVANFSETYTATSGTLGGIQTITTTNPGSNSTADVFGSVSQATIASGNVFDHSSLQGATNRASHEGTGTLTNAYGSINYAVSSTGIINTSVGSLNVAQNDSTNTFSIAVGSTGNVINSSSGTIGVAVGLEGLVSNSSTGTISFAVGVESVLQNTNVAGIITTNVGFLAQNPTNSGTITENYGALILAQTAATSDYGIAIEAADTQTLWLSSDADNTTASAGIAFGISRDTNLYRGAANELTTDDNLHVVGTIQVDTLNAATATGVCIDGSNILSACTSSARYKDNIEDLGYGLDTLLQLRPVSYDWKGTGIQDFGFIAEEVATVNPMFATYDKIGQVQGVKYDQLTAVITNAIKEQQNEIETLQQQITGQGQSPAQSSDLLNLNVAGPVTSQSLSVSGTTQLAELTVHGASRFEGDVTVVSGHFVGNPDTRGTLVIPAGSTQAAQTFNRAFYAEPNVVLTPRNFIQGAWRVEASTQGFIIYLETPAAQDGIFNYQVQQ